MSHSADGARESRLVCPEDSRRAPEARIRGVRTHGVTLSGRLIPNGSAAKRWLASVKNHKELIFTVHAWAFRILYCFFVIDHRRRRILHFNERSIRRQSG